MLHAGAEIQQAGGGGIISCHRSSESGTTGSFESALGGEEEGDKAKVTCEQCGPSLPEHSPPPPPTAPLGSS